MDFCPHCGEPLEEYAAACPHCGSDWETGWSPDADLYSFELPDDEADEFDRSALPHSSTSGFEDFVWTVCVVVAAVVFVWASYRVFDAVVSVLGLAVLTFSFLVFHRWTRKGIRLDC